VPYIKTAGEIKTKPTQHSVKELRSIGIQPDILVCRSDLPLRDEERSKIALFTNVELPGVISLPDLETIYQIPLHLYEQGMDKLVVEKLNLKVGPADLRAWQTVLEALENPLGQVNIGMVGKYIGLEDSYKSLNEALIHAGIQNKVKVNIHHLDAEKIAEMPEQLQKMDAILVPGGFGERGVEGKIFAAEYARKNNIPYLGICLGMQVAVIGFARSQVNYEDANSTEFNADTKHPVIALVSEWQTHEGVTQTRTDKSDKGGTMRLGGYECQLVPNTLARKLYGKDTMIERHRHRYEVNNELMPALEQAGLTISGRSKDGLVEIIELSDHPWFIACQFHPEFLSTPRESHPLFSGFIVAANDYQKRR
jgi:CTP synthase